MFTQISKLAGKIVDKGIKRGDPFTIFKRERETQKWVEVDIELLTKEELYYCMARLNKYKATWCFAPDVAVLESKLLSEKNAIKKGMEQGEPFTIFKKIDNSDWIEVDHTEMSEAELEGCLIALDNYNAKWILKL